MTFPQIVAALMTEGFESYMVDFRRGIATYYLPDGDSVDLRIHTIDGTVSTGLRCDDHSGCHQGSQRLRCQLYLMWVFAERSRLPAVQATSFHSPAAARSISAVPPKRMSSIFWIRRCRMEPSAAISIRLLSPYAQSSRASGDGRLVTRGLDPRYPSAIKYCKEDRWPGRRKARPRQHGALDINRIYMSISIHLAHEGVNR